jgi:hypothetical protein
LRSGGRQHAERACEAEETLISENGRFPLRGALRTAVGADFVTVIEHTKVELGMVDLGLFADAALVEEGS